MILPRIIRLRDAPAYLGMDKNRFNAEVCPSLHEQRMGKHGVAFDRLELDAWADKYFGVNGRSAQAEEFVGNSPGSSNVRGDERGRTRHAAKTPISKERATTGTFAALAERLIRKRQNAD